MADSRVTLTDLADHLGLSNGTVSMALRGVGRVSAATRQRVREAAEELGYRPDPLMSAFSRHRQKGASPGSVIAIIGEGGWEDWMEPLLPTAARLGYRLECFGWNQYPSQAALVRVLEARGMAGVIFMESKVNPVPDVALWQRLRCVQCGPFPSGDDSDCPFPIVRNNPFDAMSVGWKVAVGAGYRRIGFLLLSKKPVLENIEAKMLASCVFHQQQSAGSTRLDPLEMTIDQSRQEAGRELTRHWLENQRPDMVILSSFRGYELLLECGCRIPQDFPVINLRQSEKRRETAGLTLDRVAVINTAICHLHAIIQHGSEMQTAHQPTIVLNPIWQDGDSWPVIPQAH